MVSSLLAFAPMGFFVVDNASSSGLILSHVLYKAAFVIALMRCVVFWALRLRQTLSSSSASSSSAAEQGFDFLQAEYDKESCSRSSSASTQLIRDCLIQTTFAEVTKRRRNYGSNGGGDCDTCAVCLCQLEMGDEVREMRNCCHVFHTECIDRWLEYNDRHHHHHDEDNHKTCPLCRTPLLTSSQIQSLSWDHSRSQPSWAVERLLYLFGDDLVL
ncbi:RING-H2 finger protein ATL65-like [Pyrus communis]|uniref:RING-H2 finger protein ATL65-like n=1 Tax=Pyrus communis TaxID=23211 RepID=UPI0035C09019